MASGRISFPANTPNLNESDSEQESEDELLSIAISQKVKVVKPRKGSVQDDKYREREVAKE